MDVPEETGWQFKMALSKPLQIGSLRDGVPELRPLDTICVFEWTGYFDSEGTRTKEGTRESVRIYELRDIEKR